MASLRRLVAGLVALYGRTGSEPTAEQEPPYEPGRLWLPLDWRPGRSIQVHVQEWTIALDTFETGVGSGEDRDSWVYTRIRASYLRRDDLRFTIQARPRLRRVIGPIEVGDPVFDRRFAVTGSEDSKVRALLSNPRIRALLLAQPEVRRWRSYGRFALTVRDHERRSGPPFEERVAVLYFEEFGRIADVGRLNALLELFTELLNQLCAIGCASENDPGGTSPDAPPSRS